MLNNKSRSAARRSAATIADVAKRAGVSPMTVSRVVNGEANVREATREKVNAAIAALNYTPNQAARRLAGSKLIRIAILYSNPSAGYLNELHRFRLGGSGRQRHRDRYVLPRILARIDGDLER